MGLEAYKIHTNPIAPEKSILSGDCWRITVLTPSLLRMEYSEEGIFEDRPTQSVLNRNFPTPDFSVEDGEELTIYTSALELHYDKKAFSPSGLSIKVNSCRGLTWHYGEETDDLLGTARTLDNVDGVKCLDVANWHQGKNMTHGQHKGQLDMGHGILSREGFSWFDDSKSMCLLENGWIEPRKKGICDFYFFAYGHRYLEALKDFYRLCGETPLLPRYALGNWWSRYHRYTEEEYKELITRFEEEKVPFAVSVVDMDWHLVDDVDPKYGSGWTGYTWNKKFFPDPEGFMAWLHEHHLKITLNVHPADGVRAFEELYEPVAVAMGIDPASERPVLCDPADPKFMEVYFRELHHPLERQGVDFWWIDWQQGTVTKQEGLDPLWVFNHYHFQDSSWKGNRKLTFSRYAGVGSHRYPVGFSGDTVISWESLQFQPWFTATASNIGYGWWSHDIGGHMLGVRDDELATRWVQYGVFSPINRLHSTDNPFSGKEPWKFNRIACEVMEKFLRLRHGLVPYLYTMNLRANKEAKPLVWPMYYAEPDQQEAYEVPNEYYFGSELICAPITVPQSKAAQAGVVSAWLPKGMWADFFTGMVYRGGRMLNLWRGIEDMPVLMKQGAIVPMKNMEQYDNSTENPAAMEVRIFAAADGSFTLWEDQGDEAEDLISNWVATHMDIQADDGKFTISGAMGNLEVIPEKRSWKLVFVGIGNKPYTVLVNGNEIPTEAVYNRQTQMLTIWIPKVPVTSEILVSFGEPLSAEENDVAERCYKLLEKAQIEYETKRALLNLIERQGRGAAASLFAYQLDESVLGELIELLLA